MKHFILKNKKSIKNIVFYTLPTLFSKGISLFLVPLYMNVLSVYDFGKLEILLLLDLFLKYVASFGMASSYVRFGAEETINFKNLSRTLIISRIIIIFSIILILNIIGFKRISLFFLGEDIYSLSILGVLFIFIFRDIISFWETKLRLDQDSFNYAILNIFLSLSQISFTLFFVLEKKLGINGIIWGQAIGILFVLLNLIIFNGRWLFKGVFDLKILKTCLKFGLPLVPVTIAMFVNTSSDKFMISKLLQAENGFKELAYYALAFKFYSLITLITFGFGTFWSPYVFKNYKKVSAKNNFNWFFRNYLYVLFLLSILIISVAPLSIHFIPTEYKKAFFLIPLLMSIGLLYQVGDYFCLGIDIMAKTKKRFKYSLLMVPINISLNFILIPLLGSAGACIATFVGNLSYIIPLMINSNKLYPISYPIKMWILATFMISFYSAIMFLNNTYINYTYIVFAFILVTYLYLKEGGTKGYIQN